MTRAYNTATTQQNSGGAVAGITAGKNAVLNSAFNVWQRGTSVSGAGGGAYTADRWFLYAGNNGAVSRQVTGDTTNLPNIQYCARVGRPVSTTDTTGIPFSQSFETVNSIPFAGKTITWSFYARKGANYSAASSILYTYLYTGTGTDQNQRSTGYTGQAQPIAQTVTLTTTWQRFQFTATLATNITELSLDYSFAPVGTAGAADYFEVTGVQLEVGSVATPYAPYSPIYQGELAACQRYYWRTGGDNLYQYVGNGGFLGANAGFAFVNNPTTMRVPATSMDFSTMGVYDYGAAYTLTNLTFYSNDKNGNLLETTQAGGGTTYRPFLLRTNNSLSAYLGFSAEL